MLSNLQCFFALFTALLLLVLAGCGGGDSSSSSSSSSDSGYYQVSGTISAGANLAFDGDINDEDADHRANDSFDEAQEIASDVTLSGYINVAGSGEQGRSFSGGDPSDFFKADLESGQQIALSFTRGKGLELYLYDSDRVQLNYATGADTATLVVDAAGTYYVEVTLSSGASIYSLTVGDSVSRLNGPQEMHLSDSFVPGDLIVRFVDESRGISAASLSSSLEQRAAQLGLQGYEGAPGRPMRMGFDTVSQRNQAFARLGIESDDATLSMSSLSSDQSDKLATIKIAQALRQRDDIAAADLNYYRSLSAITPDDTLYSNQAWHYELINLPDAWDRTSESNTETYADPVVVAVIDTGVLLEHPDLSGRVGDDGYDFISYSSESTSSASGGSLDGDGIDDDPDDPGDRSVSDGSSSFHGTHVAGTIAAEGNNGEGVTGILWGGCTLMPLRVLGYGGTGTSYDIMQALSYAAGFENDSGTKPDKVADIINLSLGGASYSQSEQDLYTDIHDAGIIVVAAVGNDYGGDVNYPAAYEDVVAVSAVAPDDTAGYALANYSNEGAEVDVAAPGGDADTSVYSTLGDDDLDRETDGFYTYGGYSGTSMATPHVAGVAALVKREFVDLTAADFDALLQSGKLTDSSSRSDEFGYGLIDADAAVDWALNDGVVPTVLVTDPATLSFDDTTTSEVIEVYLSGSASSTGTVSASVDASWISVAADDVDAYGVGDYSVSVETSDMGSGEQSATLTFASTDSGITAVAVPVTLDLESATWAVDGGYFYVQLCTPFSGDVLYYTTGTLVDGELEFTLDDVEAGTYELVAGTDSDFDGIVDEENEIGGSYQRIISVGSDRSSLDFEVSLVND
jgi:serine protease